MLFFIIENLYAIKYSSKLLFYFVMEIVPHTKNSIFKNRQDQSFNHQTDKLFPYKTQALRLTEFGKSRNPTFKRFEKRKNTSNFSSPTHQLTPLINQEDQNKKNHNKTYFNQEKVRNPSIFSKFLNNHESLKSSDPIKFSPNLNENTSILNKIKLKGPDSRRNVIQQKIQASSQQSQVLFRKTLCISMPKTHKNMSLEMRKDLIRPPTTQIQTSRQSTRIRKVTNIGQQSDKNFLAKYEIIRELGKGTYGVVYLAKVMGRKYQKLNFMSNFTSHLSKLTTKQSEIQVKNDCDKVAELQSQTIENIQQQIKFQDVRTDNFLRQQNIVVCHTPNSRKFLKEQDSISQRNQKYLGLNQNYLSNKQYSQDQTGSRLSDADQQLSSTNSPPPIATQNHPQTIKDIKIQTYLQQMQLVAIKVYQKFKMNKDPSKFKNIRKQITIMQNLSHPGVIKLYESVQSLTKISLVVQFGGDLSLLDYLKDNFPLSREKLKMFTKQLLDIIIYLHNKNVVHRDIKPQNILVKIQNHKEFFKLIDYGFSTLANKSRKLNVICGTPNFMAPELLSEREYYGEKADVWSFGIVIFVMAEGRHPFKSANYQQLSRIANKGKYIFKRKHQPLFEQFIAQILKVNSEQRPTAQQISKFKWLNQQ